MPMTPAEIARHNQTNAELTAQDGIPRLTWEQWGEAFQEPAQEVLAPGQLVAAWDSATPGTVGALRDEKYDVTFPDLNHVSGPCRYKPSQLRPWPIAATAPR